MSQAMITTPDPAVDLTIDARSPSQSQESAAFCCRGGVVAKSKVGLTSFTRTLLLVRLRAAAIMLLGGFTAFLLWTLVVGVEFFRVPNLWLYELGAITILACALGGLFIFTRVTTFMLRFAEFVIFATPAVFFLIVDSLILRQLAEANGASIPISASWLILMMIYALMIPNTWRRAAVVLGLCLAAPMVLLLVLRASGPPLSEMLAMGRISVEGLKLTVGAVAATYGVYVINSLRTRVFEANQIGLYQLKRLLGRGGMGEVHLAEHQLLKRPAAIKVITPQNAGDPKAMIRFEREVQTAATLTHPNTIEIYDYGHTDDGTFYYVMEFLKGLNLSDLVKRHGALPEQRVLHLLQQAAGALGEAHRAGLIHRDLKPANIFAAVRGGLYDYVKLLDFGLVKDSGQANSPEVQRNDVTMEGSITGSPHYMSPEQSVGGTADARSDLYSLGAVGYFLLTGRPPFDGENPMAVLIAHARDGVTPLSDLRGEISPKLEAIIHRCLEKQPEERFQSAEELAAALDQCVIPGEWTFAKAAKWWQTAKPAEIEQELVQAVASN
ncbi:MAG: serine/threonine protein kinase [Pirellulales bacterium]|nr:serine/threonine protein kinase [Pirellulales bacterium]